MERPAARELQGADALRRFQGKDRNDGRENESFFVLELSSVVQKCFIPGCWCVVQILLSPFAVCYESYLCFCSGNRRAVDLSSGNP